MKQQHVRERVYESGRLARAWQQVRQNAVAAGIDEEQMAIGDQERSPLRLEPAMVQRAGAIFPA